MLKKIFGWLEKCLQYRSDLEIYLSHAQNHHDVERITREYFLKQSRQYFNI